MVVTSSLDEKDRVSLLGEVCTATKLVNLLPLGCRRGSFDSRKRTTSWTRPDNDVVVNIGVFSRLAANVFFSSEGSRASSQSSRYRDFKTIDDHDRIGNIGKSACLEMLC